MDIVSGAVPLRDGAPVGLPPAGRTDSLSGKPLELHASDPMALELQVSGAAPLRAEGGIGAEVRAAFS